MVFAASPGEYCFVREGALIYQVFEEEGKWVESENPRRSIIPILNRMKLPVRVADEIPDSVSKDMNTWPWSREFKANWIGGNIGVSTISDGWDDTTFTLLFQEKDVITCE